MKHTFTEVLQNLGHIYVNLVDPADSYGATKRLRHIGANIGEDGIPIALCTGKPIGADEYALTLPQLQLDADCPECRQKAQVPDAASLTKRAVMVECINIMINIEQAFVDAMWWNGHRPEGEEAINPDPDGELAAAWQQNAIEVVSMIERCRPTMEKHAARFGWPEQVEETSAQE